MTHAEAAFPPSHFKDAFKELTDTFGFVETWAVYRQVEGEQADLNEQELYRYQFEAADTDENWRWLLKWRLSQEKRFGCEIWLIRYRLP